MRKKLLSVLFLLSGFFVPAGAQFYSVRTNMLGLATTNLNLEGSMTLNRKWSLHVPLQYNPFILGDNRQFRNLTIAPGVRYWLLESYSNKFIGFHALASTYSIGNIWDKYRYEGDAFGAGISVGRAYPIARSWNIEWELGAALAWLRYDKYKCKECGAYIGKEYECRIIPSRIALNLVYLF